jgi:hypothetical protein
MSIVLLLFWSFSFHCVTLGFALALLIVFFIHGVVCHGACGIIQVL